MASSETVSVTGNGSLGLPFTGAVILDPDPQNWAHATTDGVRVLPKLLGPDGEPLDIEVDGSVQIPPPCIKDTGGLVIEPDEDGCVQLTPLGTLDPAIGCGLRAEPGDEPEDPDNLVVATSGDWPGSDLQGVVFGGTAAEDGIEIYCDANGELRGPPDHSSRYAEGAEVVFGPGLETVEGGDTWDSDPMAAIVFTNPTIRRMTLLRLGKLTIDISVGANGLCKAFLQARYNGGAWADVGELRPSCSPDAAIRSSAVTIGIDPVVLSAGASMNMELRARVVNDGAVDVAVVQAGVSARMVGFTR
jgi:hypothetical protein